MKTKLYLLVEIHAYPNDDDWYSHTDVFHTESEAVTAMIQEVHDRISEDLAGQEFSLRRNTEEFDIALQTINEFHGWRVDEKFWEA